MPWYARKSIKIAPGIHLNFSKSGVGYSIGPRGAKYTVSPKGRVTQSFSIPGTGIRYQTLHTPGKSRRAIQNDQYTPQHESAYRGIWLTWYTTAFICAITAMITGTYLPATPLQPIFSAAFWIFLISGFVSKRILKDK